MKKSSKIILSALASAGVLAAAATAWAYPAGGQPQAGYPCPAGGPMLGPGPVMPQGAQGKVDPAYMNQISKHIAEGLKITSAQQGVFDAWMKAVTNMANTRYEARQAMLGAESRQQALEARAKVMREASDNLSALASARKNLMNSLSADQKEIFLQYEFGHHAGSMMGGPLGKMLIERHHLLDTIVPEDDSLLVEEEIKHERHSSMYPAASFQLIIAMGIGTVLSKLLSLTGMTFPIYIGAMIAAACIRNLGEYGGKFTVYMGEINDIGGICLSLFLGMAMITLKIWQLAELALPLVVLLAGQTLFMILYSFAIVYNVMGRDYDAAVIVSGTCGFGMGATPNAMANMQAVCDKYSPSVKAYLLIPLVGSLFADFINSLVITVFINFI